MIPYPYSTYKQPEDFPVTDEMISVGVHPEGVYEWRKEQFAKMGFETHVAGYLASRRIDLHQMEMLLAKGCLHEHAVRILADTAYNGEDTTEYLALAYEDDTEALVAS